VSRVFSKSKIIKIKLVFVPSGQTLEHFEHFLTYSINTACLITVKFLYLKLNLYGVLQNVLEYI